MYIGERLEDIEWIELADDQEDFEEAEEGEYRVGLEEMDGEDADSGEGAYGYPGGV